VSQSRCGGCAQKCVLRSAARSSSTLRRSFGEEREGKGRKVHERGWTNLKTHLEKSIDHTTVPSSVGVLMRRCSRGMTVMPVHPLSRRASSGARAGSIGGGGVVVEAEAAAISLSMRRID
jgi:hypothetical protein